MVQPTTLMVSSPYRGPLSTLPVPWGTIQLGNIAFPTQRDYFSVILDQSFSLWAQHPYVYGFPNSLLQENKIFLMAVRFSHSWDNGASCSQIQHLHLTGGVTSAQSSSRTGD